MAGRKTTPVTKIASLRLDAGLTQRQAAEMIGMGLSTLTELEIGRRPLAALAFGTALKMATVYNCSAEDLIG